MGAEARERWFTALKTNLFLFDDGHAHAWRPGFAAPFYPELNVERRLIRNLRDHPEALRDAPGPDTDIPLDPNFVARTEAVLKLPRSIAVHVQIGRRSCRERVVQVVSSSWVGVQYQKN